MRLKGKEFVPQLKEAADSKETTSYSDSYSEENSSYIIPEPSLKLKFSDNDLIKGASVYTEVINSGREIVAELSLSLNDTKEIDVSLGDYYEIRGYFPNGKIVKAIEYVKEDRYYNVELPFIQIQNKQLAWQEFLGNFPILKKLAQTIDHDSSIWQRLWSYNKQQKQWQIVETEEWELTELTRDEKFIYYQLEILQGTNKLHFLQLGGKQITWRLISLPLSNKFKILITPVQNSHEYDNDIASVVKNDIKVSVISADPIHQKSEILLSYLRAGKIRGAKVIFEYICNKLQSLNNPLVAIFCSYYSLKIGDSQRFPELLQNFLNSMEWLPDIAIICGQQLRLNSNSDLERSRDLFLRASELGLPIYTQGMRLLFDSLKVFNYTNPEDEQVKKALEKIRPYAATVDWSKCLTTFYGISPEEPSYQPSKLKIGIPNYKREIFWLMGEDNKLSDDNEESLELLKETIQLGKGQFELIYYRDNNNLQEQITRRIPEIQVIELKPSTKELSSTIQEKLKKESQALIISGWEYVIEIDSLLKNTNKEWETGTLRKKSSCPLIFVLPDKIVPKVSNHAGYISNFAKKINFTADNIRKVA